MAIKLSLPNPKLLAFVLVLLAPLVQAADPTQGASVFDEECSECHSVKPGKNKKGPSLFAVVGRPAGSFADFNYSDAMKASGITWNNDRLDHTSRPRKRWCPGAK